jgi:hypothetical protein
VLTKVELIVIRNEFSVQHMYLPMEAVTNKHVVLKKPVEFGHYDGVCNMLINLVHENCKETPHRKAVWLLDVIFTFGKKTNFATGQEIHIHVMGSLDTMINMTKQEA